MAKNGLIARRPKNDKEFSDIKGEDKDCLSVKVAFGWSNERIFLMFHPEYADIKKKKPSVSGSAQSADASGVTCGLSARGRKECEQFFSFSRHKEFMDAYRGEVSGVRCQMSDGEDEEISESRKDEALKKLFNRALRIVDGGGELDPDTLKVTAEIFKKLGILKEEEEEVEAPRRYLPETCSRCRYKAFVEEGLANGDIVDE